MQIQSALFETHAIRRVYDEKTEKWIQQRMTGQETRNKLTDYWADHDINKGEEFAILTR